MYEIQANTQSHPNYCPDVAAVLVTYNPDTEQLHVTIRALLGQVKHIFIVDNASANLSDSWFEEYQSDKIISSDTQLHFLPQNDNYGIGAAHNIGIKAALVNKVAYVLLLDQDSTVAPDMVSRLRSAHVLSAAQRQRVAVVGPRYYSAENASLSGFVRVGMLHFTHHDGCNNLGAGANDGVLVEADFLVSSGSLISAEALTVLGFMDASLFIDHVDTEWCFRARAAGWRIYGVCNATMTHTLGENRRVVWFLRRRNVPFHLPFRYYYMLRNSVLLYQRSYMPWKWKLADFVRCLQMLLFFGIMSPNRLDCLRMMWLGIVDGLNGRHGRRDDLL